MNGFYLLIVIHEVNDTPRTRRRDANRERILDAALELVAAGGLEGLSMSKLAGAVDYTPGALYRYFDSKDALLSQLVARTLEGLRARLDAAVARLPGRASPFARVFALVQGYRDFARVEPHRFALLAMTMADPRVLLQAPEDAEPVALAIMAAMQPLAHALGEAAEAGALVPGNVAERTLATFASLEGALLLSKQARRVPELFDVDRLAVYAIRSLLLGWGAKPRAVDAGIARAAATVATEVEA